MITVRINGEKSTNLTLQRLMAGLKNRGGFFKTWAHNTALMAQESARSHSKGGMFWPGIARQTKVTVADQFGAVIKCEHFAGAQKEYGGTITAKNAGALTIPIAPQAKGKRAGEFSDLFCVKGFLFSGIKQGKGKRKVSLGQPLFVLKKSVTQRAEPWWPKPSPVLDQGISLAAQQLAREMAR